MAAYVKKKSSSFSFGFPVHTTSESKSHSQSVSPNKKQNKKAGNKQSPRKGRQQAQNIPQNEPSPNEDDPTNNNVQFMPHSVSKLLDSNHLNANAATAIHDLQCATGTVVLQAFLEYPRLRRVLGIEQNKEYFHLAQQNAVNLTKAGYNGRKFFLVDNIPGVKTIIAECSSPEIEASKSFNKGEIVACLQSLKRNNIDKREDYRGIISNVKKGGELYDITMSATKKVIQNVKKEHIFKQGTERTLEFARCNLFQRKDGFRSDIILLPFYISNDNSYKTLLFQALTHAPFNSRILAYEKLEEWEHFETIEYRQSLRRIDCNVYDNDRFSCNLSNFYKVYLYKHVISPFNATPIAKLERNGALRIGNYVGIRDNTEQRWITSQIKNIDNGSITVTRYQWEAPFEEEIKLESQKIHLTEYEFNIGDIVHCYCTKHIVDNKPNKWNLYRCGVFGQNPDGTYEIEFEDGELYRKQLSVWMFRPPKYLFEEGAMLMASRYDEMKINEFDNKTNDRTLPAPRQDLCVVRHRNPDGSYRVEFLNQKFRYHDSFCESWLRKLTEPEELCIEPVIPLALEIDYERTQYWRPNMTCHWLRKCGFEEDICRLFLDNSINGTFLLNLTFDALINDLNIPINISNKIYGYIRSLRRQIGHRHSDDSAFIESITNSINKYKSELQKLTDIEFKANSNLNEAKSKQKLQNNNNKALKDYDIKIKCIQMSNAGSSKKDISKKLNKPMNWVNKFYKQNANSIKRPNTSNAEVDNAQENLNRIRAQIKEIQAKIDSEQNRLRMYDTR